MAVHALVKSFRSDSSAAEATELVVKVPDYWAILPSFYGVQYERPVAPTEVPTVSEIDKLLYVDLSERHPILSGSVEEFIGDCCCWERHAGLSSLDAKRRRKEPPGLR